MYASAPMPPTTPSTPLSYAAAYSDIQPAANYDSNPISYNDLNAAPSRHCKTSSSFSVSGPTIGYEVSGRTHVGFDVKPDIDVFDPSDADVRFGLNFTVALGMPSNDRPKCTHNGYYGMIPALANTDVSAKLNRVTDMDNIKSYVEDRIEAREHRAQERQKRLKRGF
jgi:hypothetical protein